MLVVVGARPQPAATFDLAQRCVKRTPRPAQTGVDAGTHRTLLKAPRILDPMHARDGVSLEYGYGVSTIFVQFSCLCLNIS